MNEMLSLDSLPLQVGILFSFSTLEEYMSHGATQRVTDTLIYWRPRFQSQALLRFKINT